MKGKKSTKWLIIVLAILIVTASIILYNTFNTEGPKDGVKLNLFEQRWIQNNKNKIINISIPNNIPVFSYEGSGIAFSFLNFFEEGTELELNKVPYIELDDSTANSIRILRNSQKTSNKDLLFYLDNYVLVSKTQVVKKPVDQLTGTIGVLDIDFNDVSSYLVGNKLTFTRVDDIDNLILMLNEGEVDYIIVPELLYLDVIIENDFYIINTLNNLSLKYVLTLSEDGGNLNDIIKKYYKEWTNNYLADNYYTELLNLYTSIKQIDDKSKTDFKSKRYIYGYVENPPYEVNKNGELAGLSGEFIKSFTAFSEIEFNFKRYENVKELNKALEEGKIDIALNYHDLNTANTYKTVDILYSDYIILVKDGNYIIDTIKSLEGETIYTLKDSKLSSYISKNSRFNVKEVDRIELLKNRNLILMDYKTYTYYKNDYFNDYNVVYQNKIDTNYGYVIKKKDINDVFYNVFNYYISTLNHKQYENVGIKKIMTKAFYIDLSLLWLYVILIPIFIGLMILIVRKRKKIIKVRNDIKLKYIDPLTSLKNRYYLNTNIAKWEENKIYPQAIIVININNLKDINDAYGYEGGDQLIKAAANILINNQIEKTDIIRTDGNEFVIYMVGYEESAVIAYVRKLYRLLKDLPYEYGASLGYSMIEDDIKTIEDAINEAILDMITNREAKQNNDI
ncbi:MAG TPA: GGDEF domain-containing protein [Mollicutes bacterium]|nr:GGDEF domain-containing protein [Mollicutes bacterium]